MRLIGKPGGVVGDCGVLQANHRKRIVGITGHRLDEGRRPLGDEPLVDAVDEDQANRRIGPGEKPVYIGGLDLNQDTGGAADPAAR